MHSDMSKTLHADICSYPKSASVVGQESLWARVLSIMCSLPERVRSLYKGSLDSLPHVLREKYVVQLLCLSQYALTFDQKSATTFATLLPKLLTV